MLWEAVGDGSSSWVLATHGDPDSVPGLCFVLAVVIWEVNQQVEDLPLFAFIIIIIMIVIIIIIQKT